MRLFYDFSANGSLCNIFLAMYKFKTDKALRRFDLTNPNRKDDNMNLCMAVQEHLIKEEFHRVPVVMVKETVKDKDKEKVKEIVKKRGGQITNKEENATHIIHPNAEFNPDRYCRPGIALF